MPIRHLPRVSRLQTDEESSDSPTMDTQSTVATQETSEDRMTPVRQWDEPLIGAVTPGSALKMCAVAFGIWVVGHWISGVRTPVKGINALGSGIAILGLILFVVSAYVLIRVVQLRRPR